MLVRAGYRPDSIRSLHPGVGERYFVSPSGPATINYTGLPLDTIEDAVDVPSVCQIEIRILSAAN